MAQEADAISARSVAFLAEAKVRRKFVGDRRPSGESRRRSACSDHGWCLERRCERVAVSNGRVAVSGAVGGDGGRAWNPLGPHAETADTVGIGHRFGNLGFRAHNSCALLLDVSPLLLLESDGDDTPFF